MAYQDNAFQTAGPRAYQLTLTEQVSLPAGANLTSDRSLQFVQELFLAADAAFDSGGPTTVSLRIRVFARLPSRFTSLPNLLPGENEPLAEPVLFFHKDSQVNLDFTILNPDGTAYNLTGATVDLLAQPERGAALTFACTVIDPANGKARRTVAVGDFSAGAYQAQLKVTSGSVVFHTVKFRVLVAEAIVP